MQLLNYFYQKNNEITDFYQRRFTIPDSSRVFIYGSPSSGKTYLVLDYLMNFDKNRILYIDFLDPKFTFIDIDYRDIELFIEQNSIQILVFDHYLDGYFSNFPDIKQLIILSNRYYNYSGFIDIDVSLLDYEEFFSFQKRGSEKQIFSLFLKRGTIPQLAIQNRLKEHIFLDIIHNHFSNSEQKFLNILAHFNSSIVTTHQIYTYAKERYKVSKDSIYKQVKDFELKRVIYFISDYLNSKNRKLIFFDFALAKYLSFSQNFPKEFDTMVALSLLKHNVKFQTFGIIGYISGDTIITPAPFDNEELAWKKAHSKFLAYRDAYVNRVYIITVNSHYSFRIENIEFEALPFYEWVVINSED